MMTCEPVYLDCEMLNTRGEYIVRPQNAVGTMGWHPIPWDVAVTKNPRQAKSAFLRKNPNWKSSQIKGVLQ